VRSRTFLLVPLGVVGLLLALLVLDLRVLIGESKVEPGKTFVVAGHGDLGKAQQATLVCRYFTGRSIKTQVFWYSANNMFGKDQCPFVLRGD
jgi:hypothetical protein